MRQSAELQLLVRRLYLLAGLVLLIVGLWGGLERMGWTLIGANTTIVVRHGGLLVAGFVGTLITLERVVALGDRIALLAPLGVLAGALSLLVGAPEDLGLAFITFGAAGLTATFIALMFARGRSLELGIMTAGALFWTIGSILSLTGQTVPEVVPWWMAFLVFTIAGERLELIRFQGRRFSRPSLGAVLVVLGLGVVVTPIDVDSGARLGGAGLVAVAIWLAVFDRSRRALPRPGLPRYSAAAMILATVWLAVSGVIWLTEGALVFGLRYDALIHTFFLGFTMTAILAHGPIILPSVASLPLRFTPVLYAPLALLQASLAIRIAADFAEWQTGREWGGMINAVALLGFFAMMGGLALLGRRRRGRPRGCGDGVLARSGASAVDAAMRSNR